jgi:hypothetical protein
MDRKWKTKYHTLMMSGNYDSGISLKTEYFPNSFFKYRKLDSRTLENINENKVWLSEIALLNDPFECSLQFDNNECLRLFFSDKGFQKIFSEKTGKELSVGDINKIVSSDEPYLTYNEVCNKKGIRLNIPPDKQLETVQNRFKQIIDDTNKEIRICSFSELNNSLLLWSHYANEHKGICIEYDFRQQDQIRAFLQPIIYSNKIYKLGLLEELTMLRKIGSSLIKGKDWKYEAEWRLTIFKQGDIFPNKMTVLDPKAVYLGTRFDFNEEYLKDQLFNILNKKNIPFFQMTKHPEQYKLIKKK